MTNLWAQCWANRHKWGNCILFQLCETQEWAKIISNDWHQYRGYILRVLTGKEHKILFWTSRNIQYSDPGGGQTGLHIGKLSF